MMKGPYEVRPGLTLPDGDILYPDPAIFDTTLAMLDFGDTWAGAGKVEGYAANDRISNICYVDDFAYPNLPMPFDGNGIQFAEHNGSKITLPDSFIIPAGCQVQLVRLWVKFATSDVGETVARYNNQVVVIGETYASAKALTYISANNTETGEISNFPVGAWGAVWDTGQAFAAAKTGDVVQLAWLATKIDAEYATLRTFVNGRYAGDFLPAKYSARPADILIHQINNKGASENTVRCTVYRLAIDDLTDSTMTAEDIVARDFAENNGRFS
ncbi:TPA: hypothetical protein MC683_000087 [Klebsiella pneumoniae]|nr:hypothetical protein [Klebsiella pneumoniae]